MNYLAYRDFLGKCKILNQVRCVMADSTALPQILDVLRKFITNTMAVMMLFDASASLGDAALRVVLFSEKPQGSHR